MKVNIIIDGKERLLSDIMSVTVDSTGHLIITQYGSDFVHVIERYIPDDESVTIYGDRNMIG